MYGIAQKLLSTYEGRDQSDLLSQYSLLKSLFEQGFIDSVDLELAFKTAPKNSHENVYLFLCYLSQATRQGNLCVSIEDQVIPKPCSLWNNLKDDVEAHLLNAVKNLPDIPVKHEAHRYYLPKYYQCEKLFIHHFERLIEHQPSLTIPEPDITNLKLLPEQAKAIQIACWNSLSVISGGPGTGKTHAAGVLIQVLWDAFTPDQKSKARFILTAPTGKAAINLQKSFQRVCDSLEGFQTLRAQTLHSLLGIRPGVRQGRPLSEDVIIVDECSMIDVHMMSQLLSCVKNGARLVLLGDSHQLPPVEAGSLFTDMIGLLEEVGELTHCIRVELQGIRDLSEAIYEGDVDKSLFLLNSQDRGVTKLSFNSERISQLLQDIVLYASELQPKLKDLSYESIKAYLESFCLLSPLRRGLFGVDSLNQKIFENLKNDFARPIMITKNDSRFGLFNGDTGVLVNGDTAIFLDVEKGLKKIPSILLPNFEYAYCMSVHKSQGSEFDHVALLMPQGAEIFGREVFYTGVTRARKQVDIWGSDDTLRATIEKRSVRYSGVGK
ncbi:MAG: RecBCD enzyme subunit RecD [Chlamydiae bacterium]|nr:RecBCD enzyme subunit RecD [Chlamydiota bacterium]